MFPSIKVKRGRGGFIWVLRCKYGTTIAKSLMTYTTRGRANTAAEKWCEKLTFELIQFRRLK